MPGLFLSFVGLPVHNPHEISSPDNSSHSSTLDTGKNKILKLLFKLFLIPVPKLGDLNRIVINRIKDYWEYTAYALEFEMDDVEGIRTSQQDDSKKCCWQTFKDWLNTAKACGVEPKTWSVLLLKLREIVELESIFDEIESDVLKLPLK